MKRIDLDKFQPLTDASKEMLFVFGAARSGTTYLGKVMDKYFDFGMGPEGSILSAFGPQIGKYGDLQQQQNMLRLLSDLHDGEMLTIMRERWREEIRTDVTLEMLWEQLPENSFAGAVYAVFSSVALGQNKTRIGNKDPAYLRQLELIHRLFPVQARYLDIVRDGRDVAMSNLKMEWGQSGVLACAQNWRNSMALCEDFRRKVPPERYLQIKYEELLDQPLNTLSQIERFLGIVLTEEKRAEFMVQHESNNRKGNHGKWRHEMSENDQRIYEAVAGDVLTAAGYETVFDKPSVSVGERVRGQSAELWRKIKLNLRSS